VKAGVQPLSSCLNAYQFHGVIKKAAKRMVGTHDFTSFANVGSVKGNIQKWVDQHRFRNIRFVGSHPMAGSHLRGIDAAQSDLYAGATTFVVKSSRTNKKALSDVTAFWKRLGCKTVIMSALQHDQVVGEISHLPHLIAVALVTTISEKSGRFAAAGFLDTTRIAQGIPRFGFRSFRGTGKSLKK